MKRWSFLVNPFLSATESSFVVMRKICNYTLNAVNKEPTNVFMHSCYTTLTPFANEYFLSFDNWRNNKALSKGKTSNLSDLLLILRSEKIREWDIQIQVVHPHSTPEYIALLPNYRTPFQSGSQLDRMSAVNTLGIGLTDDVALATLRTEVGQFYTDLKTVHNSQVAGKSNVGIGSDSVENARINIGVELYGVLGLMINHFKTTPDSITNYFDLETIRNHEQTTFRGKVAGGETVIAMKHTFGDGEDFIIINRGKTTLRVDLSANQDTPIGVLFMDILPLTNKTIIPKELGELDICRFLKVHNMDANLSGAYTIELL